MQAVFFSRLLVDPPYAIIASLVNSTNKPRPAPEQVSELTTNRLSIYLRCLTELEAAG